MKVSKTFGPIFRTLATSTSAQPKPRPRETFYHNELKIIQSTQNQPDLEHLSRNYLKFGEIYANHMLEVDWNEEHGWFESKIRPFGEIELHPGAKVFHYGIEIFENLKALRGVDNKIRLFRAEKYVERMKKSAIRATLPDFDSSEMLKILYELVKMDSNFVPSTKTGSLSIHLSIAASDPNLGIGFSPSAKLFTFATPVGAYHPHGFRPLALSADPSLTKAFPKGAYGYKLGSNMATGAYLEKINPKIGCNYPLWLFGEEEWLTEAGPMNIFVYWVNEQGEEELMTPPLKDGMILSGVIRGSVLELARKWGEFKVTERYPTMEEVKKAVSEKRLLQIFVTSTSHIVRPIHKIVYKDRVEQSYKTYDIPTMQAKKDVMKRLYDTILEVQFGRVEVPGWTKVVC